jgi:hypothetical protein
MTKMRTREGTEVHRLRKDGPRVVRFPPPGARALRGRSALAALIALVSILGSLVAATLGPAVGEALPYPLLVLLMLIRG